MCNKKKMKKKNREIYFNFKKINDIFFCYSQMSKSNIKWALNEKKEEKNFFYSFSILHQINLILKASSLCFDFSFKFEEANTLLYVC